MCQSSFFLNLTSHWNNARRGQQTKNKGLNAKQCNKKGHLKHGRSPLTALKFLRDEGCHGSVQYAEKKPI